MIKTKEYQECYQWAKDAPLETLVDALADNLRYPSVIRDELRDRLKGTPGLKVSDLLWDQFMKCVNGKALDQREELPVSAPPGLFMIQLRDNKEFWRWAIRGQAFMLGAEKMWKKCFDERLTTTPKEDLTDGELGLIKAFDKALRDFNIEKDHSFEAFLNDNGEA